MKGAVMAKKVLKDASSTAPLQDAGQVFEDGGDIIDRVTREQLSVDKVKDDTDFLSLLNHFGIKVRKTGKNMMALCPFHEDKNPSLSINLNDKVFNCFGCGKSGDVIKFVEYYKNIKFKEAIKFLNDFNVNGSIEYHIDESQEESDLRLDIMELEEDITQTGNDSDQTSLTGIAEHYHKELFNHQEAIEYLHKRGIKNPEIISNFKIGFSSGESLLKVLSKKQVDSLNKAGILRKNGQEAFANCLVFPIYDENSQVVHFYARNIKDTIKVKHLYLKGSHKSAFNRKAVKVYSDRMILTESIIDALSLIQLGINNVWPCYGVNGFTDEMLSMLKEHRVKEIVIAFDNDEAGKTGAEKLGKKLLDNGFSVRSIFPPQHKDWNEELTSGISTETIKKLIEDASVREAQMSKPEKTVSFNVKKDGFGYLFSIGEVNYSVSNVKDGFSHNLRINVRAEYKGERFPDNVDLYSSRSRDTLALKLSQRFGIEVKRIEKDLLLILDYLEDEQRKRISPDTEEIKELTEEEIKTGLAFLKNPDLLKMIVEDMTTLGYVGEDLNKQLLYLCATSRLMDDPISVMIVSQSASGKSYLVDTVARLIPESEVVEFHTLSQQALQYMGDKLLHKFMTMGEASHDKDIENQLRQILSGHKLSRYVVVKDEKTGEMTTEQVLIKAVVASVLTTTSSKINPENASRYFIINTDESQSQTVRIYEAQKHKYSQERQEVKDNVIPDIIRKHHIAQRLLKKIVIVIPSAMRESLKFPFKVMRLRRDHERFIDLIAVVCFLRQFQKETKTNGKFDYVECDKSDYRIAYTILINDVLRSTISEIPQQSVMIYEAVKEIARDNADIEGIKANDVTVSQREIREHTGFNQMFVKRYIRILVDYEYLKVKRGGRGSRADYSLIADEELNHIDISMIPTPDEMDKILNQ